jgi:hypothetical protein
MDAVLILHCQQWHCTSNHLSWQTGTSLREARLFCMRPNAAHGQALGAGVGDVHVGRAVALKIGRQSRTAMCYPGATRHHQGSAAIPPTNRR